MVRPTKAQADIRDNPELALLVVAPAGSGKTEALALRVQGLLDRGQLPFPERILVTTFSNRARDNIRDRLREYLTPTVMRDKVTVMNFHGLAARIFQAHANVIGLDPMLAIPESDWVRDQCQRRGLDFKSSRVVQDLLRDIKQEAADDEVVARQLERSGNRHAIAIESLRNAQGRLTYDDLPRVADLILQNETVADLYRAHFGAIIVDEFQDLTPQQLRIVQRIGFRRTTYAGDLAQGIYGFAGARPAEVEASIRAECRESITFAESHRSSPAVLNFVNSLAPLTGGVIIGSADPASWPGGGLAVLGVASTADAEAKWVIELLERILSHSPQARIGVLSRTGPRRRFVDAAIELTDLPWYRWDDALHDSESAKVIQTAMMRLDEAELSSAPDPVEYLRQVAEIQNIQDPTTREGVADGLNWCLDEIRRGQTAMQVRNRIRVDDGGELTSRSGVHLLTGHLGKGQQFDWVVIVGAEDGSIPDFRANTAPLVAEEARILAVMISRARHGVVITRAKAVPAASTGVIYKKEASRFLTRMRGETTMGGKELMSWLETADWEALNAR